MRFDDFYCVSPVCSPARASILSGTIPSVHGVQDWLRGGNLNMAEFPELQGDPLYASEHTAIPYLQNMTCFTDVLAENGYVCALSGKWHLGDSIHPQHGFSRWFTIARGGCAYYHPDLVLDGQVVQSDRYITDLITEDALKNLQDFSESEDPFCLCVHYTAPHAPWSPEHHPKEFLDLYRDCPFESTPDEPLHPWLSPAAPYKPGAEGRRESLTGYYAAISAMDAGIGKILAKLRETGLDSGHPCDLYLRQRHEHGSPRHLGQGKRHLPSEYVRLLRKGSVPGFLAGTHSGQYGVPANAEPL